MISITKGMDLQVTGIHSRATCANGRMPLQTDRESLIETLCFAEGYKIQFYKTNNFWVPTSLIVIVCSTQAHGDCMMLTCPEVQSPSHYTHLS